MINSWTLAADGRTEAITIALTDHDRLRDLLVTDVNSQQTMTAEITATLAPNEQRVDMRVQWVAIVTIYCQRCLQALSLQIQDVLLCGVRYGASRKQRVVCEDPLLVETATNTVKLDDLLVDELLLALPLAPKHLTCAIPEACVAEQRVKQFQPFADILRDKQ